MRQTPKKLLLAWGFCLCIHVLVIGQENFTGINDSVINLSCGQSCAALNFKVPHLKSTDDYEVVPIPFEPYAFTTPGGNELPSNSDDWYSSVIDLPFPVCFYGAATTYNQIVVGSNGLLTFDVSNADCFNAYRVDLPLPSAGTGVPCATTGQQIASYYPRAAIMGAYVDLNPEVSSPDKKIEWRVEGVAPFRRFVASWYKMAVYGNESCSDINPTTFQIVVNEATFVIEVFIAQKVCTPGGSGSTGKSILGIQNWERDKAVVVTDRNATIWSARKEAFRFIPSGKTSRFIKAELVDYTNGNVIEAAVFSETTPGYMDISFSSRCPSANSEKYIVRTTYAADCGAPGTIVINDTITVNKNVLPASVTTTESDCVQENGSISVTVDPGVTGPFQFQLNPGAITVNQADPRVTFTDLAPGTYSLTISTGACSSTIDDIVVGSGTTFPVGFTVNSPSCQGAQNASIILTPPALGGPYTYFINGSPQPSNIITGLPAGWPYTVVVTAANGCQAVVSVPPIPQGAGVLTGNAVASGTTCAGLSNGSITATATSGSGPYEYSIDNGQTWQSSNTFNNLSPATYAILIREGACQSDPINATVAAGTGLNITATASPASCTGVNNGSINIEMLNGTAPFTVLLNGAGPQIAATNTLVISNLAAGSYAVTVTDVAGCTVSAAVPVEITTGAGFTAAASISDVSCFGGANGVISVTPQAGGNSPYTFVLNGSVTQSGASGVNFTGLPAASDYDVIITDAAGCTFRLNGLMVSQPTALVLPAPTVQSPLCNGESSGVITLNPAGGTPPYTYSLNGGPFQPSNTFKVPAGTYGLRVQDANNCGAAVNGVTVTDPPVLTAVISSTDNATCNGGADGTINVTASGGAGDYQYSSGGGVFQSSGILKVKAGTYTVAVQDKNGCMFSIPGVPIGLTNNLTYTPIADPAPICEGTSVSLQAVSNAESFSWTPGDAALINNPSAPNVVVHPSGTTIFRVIMQLGVCVAQDEVTVRVLPAPVPEAGPDGEICFGQNYQLQATGGIHYEWTPQRFLSDPFSSSPQVLQPDRTVTYSVIATDANNCSSIIPDEVTITVIPPIRIKVTPEDTVVYAGAMYQLHATSIADNYTWTPTGGLSNPLIADPMVTAPAADGAVVRYKVTASTAAGCKGEGSATVRVYKGPDIYVPNAFSPNNDGKNDVFIPFPVGIRQLNYLTVFNRWGQMIFTTHTLRKGWDGRLAGVEQPTGVYTWMLEAITDDNRKISKKGTVTLVR